MNQTQFCIKPPHIGRKSISLAPATLTQRNFQRKNKSCIGIVNDKKTFRYPDTDSQLNNIILSGTCKLASINQIEKRNYNNLKISRSM